jgi:hypothetical protein
VHMPAMMSSSIQTICKASLIGVLAISFATGACQKTPAPSSTANVPAADYSYGTTLLFGKGGNAAAACVSGWQTPEDEFTWSDGTTAVLALRVPAGDSAITLQARMSGMIKEPEFPAQPIEVLVNDKKVANWQVGNTAAFRAPIPRDLTKAGGVLVITFRIPQANSPKKMGLSEDARVLGVRIYDLSLQKTA